MAGSIRKRGQYWEYRISLTVDGKRKQKSKSGFTTKADCQKALNAALVEIDDRNNIIDYHKGSIRLVFELFINSEAEITRKYNTIIRYKSLFKNHIDQYFNDRNIDTIKPHEIQTFYVLKLKDYSVEYVKGIHNLLHVIFDFARRNSYIKYNVMNDVKAPKITNKTDNIAIYNVTQLKAMYNRLESTNLQTVFMLGLHLGIRSGEAYALRWSDFDFKKNTVKIDKQLIYANKSWCFETVKTSNSNREITFGVILKNYLLNKLNERELLKENNIAFKSNNIIDIRNRKHDLIIVDDFVNIKPSGEMLVGNSHRVMKKPFEDLGIQFKYHNLRHTHATILLENGINPRYIQARLGHAKLEFTLRLYTHVTAKMEQQATQVIDSSLGL